MRHPSPSLLQATKWRKLRRKTTGSATPHRPHQTVCQRPICYNYSSGRTEAYMNYYHGRTHRSLTSYDRRITVQSTHKIRGQDPGNLIVIRHHLNTTGMANYLGNLGELLLGCSNTFWGRIDGWIIWRSLPNFSRPSIMSINGITCQWRPYINCGWPDCGSFNS